MRAFLGWGPKAENMHSCSLLDAANSFPKCLYLFVFSTAVNEYLFSSILANSWCYQLKKKLAVNLV